jgi:hypothetical protein
MMLIRGRGFLLCQGIPFETVEMEFVDRSHAKEWIIRNQFGRRNLLPYVRTKLALVLEDTIAARAKGNQVESGKSFGKGLQISAEPIQPIDTRAELATIAGVSHDTVAKVKKIEAKAAPPPIGEGGVASHPRARGAISQRSGPPIGEPGPLARAREGRAMVAAKWAKLKQGAPEGNANAAKTKSPIGEIVRQSETKTRDGSLSGWRGEKSVYTWCSHYPFAGAFSSHK